MDTDRKWVIVRIDGKIAAISTDYRALAAISARLAQQKSPAYGKITAETALQHSLHPDLMEKRLRQPKGR